MLSRLFVIGLLILGPVSPASAQTLAEDMRCLLLSNLFAQKGADDRQKAGATLSKQFYLGRVDGRANAAAIGRALQGMRVDASTAGAEMGACATRMQRAQQAIQAAVAAVVPRRESGKQ